jgi:hypothetical protein
MSDYQAILGVLLLLLLSECVWWIRRGSVVFRRAFPNRWVMVHPSHGFGSTGSGMAFLNPLPFLREAFLCHQWPLSITAEGIHTFVPQVINGGDRPEWQVQYVTFADIRAITRDRMVLKINGIPFVSLNSTALAAHFERLLTRLHGLPQDKREAAIKADLRRALECPRVRRRWQQYRHAVRPLEITSVALFLLLLGPLPLALGCPELQAWLVPTLGAILVALVVSVTCFWKAHRSLFPQENRARWRGAFMMILAPTHALGACSLLSRDLLVASHPLAVAHTLCPPEMAQGIARGILLDTRWPMEPRYPTDDRADRQTIDKFHQTLQSEFHAAVAAYGGDLDRWMAPPVPEDPTCQSYCPRCDRQYVIPQGTCESCGGIPLVPFTPQTVLAP